MFRPHALVAVWQQQGEARLPHPFGLAAGDELIDNALCVIVEVTELSFPHDQCVWVSQRVTKLKAHHGKFRQRRIADGELGLAGVQIIQWDVSLFIDALKRKEKKVEVRQKFNVYSCYR